MASANMIMIRRSDLLVAILCFGLCLGSVSAVPCDNNAWIEIPSANAMAPLLSSNYASNVSDCQKMCIDNSVSCNGVAWDMMNATNPKCLFNFQQTNSTDSGINYYNTPNYTTYYSLLRNYSSCSSEDYNCSFIWKGERDMHGFSGVDGNRSNLNDCIKLCQETPSCTGVDWNHDEATCWINANFPVIMGNQANITFFMKNCTNPMPFTTKPTTPGPTTTSTTTTTTTIPTTTTATTTTTTTATILPTTTTTTTTSTPSTTTTTSTTSTPPTTTTTTSTPPTTTTTTTTSTPPTTTTTTTPPTTTTTTTTTTPPTTTTMATTTPTTTMATSTESTTKKPPTDGGPSAMMVNEYAYYPQAIKPAYIVLAGLGGGCILLVITAVVILCLYPLHKNLKYSTTSTVTTVHTHQPYVETQEPERIDMGEMAEGEVKTYYNDEEAN